MDEIKLVERAFAEAPATRQVAESGRDRLLRAMATPVTARPARRRPSRLVVRLAGVGGLAAGVAVAVAVAPIGTDGAGSVANADDLLNRAAAAAEQRPFTPPKPGQWLFRERKENTRDEAAARDMRPGTPLRQELTVRQWFQVDGDQIAEQRIGIEPGEKKADGKLRFIKDPQSQRYPYSTLAALPTDPKRLAAAIEKRMGKASLYNEYLYILQTGVAPPKVEATIFRAFAALPINQRLRHLKDESGRPVIAVGENVPAGALVTTEQSFDAKTYEYLGDRLIAGKDSADHDSENKVTYRTKKGSTLMTWMVSGPAVPVDKAGQLP